ncbi:FkbM family methyltransferase [Geofilum rubicundum]|uniref:Methyltransferase FkbM n=1 Tax=Geofilum rubicundum JCM 15548 TaxID=1236989 RepID=A0A0E9LTN0_9BACT|nr:FkbM family methyltransferase [Geofilum rubicundum]GAO28486.1 methyltransferase FkbM [Geofilum rubicundum JCM 15548]
MSLQKMLHPVLVKVKKHGQLLSGKYNHLKKQVKCPSEWYGNTYGGFYVCPDQLSPESIVYSIGIGRDISFDKSILAQHHCQVFGFDPTPNSISWVKENPTPKGFRFFPYGLGKTNTTQQFYLPKNPNEVSGSIVEQSNVSTQNTVPVEIKTLHTIARELKHSYIDVLKMDIEGSEYEVIDSIIDSHLPIHQLLIEFHDRLFQDGHSRTQNAVKKLNAAGYKVFAVSDNLQEVSFIKI